MFFFFKNGNKNSRVLWNTNLCLYGYQKHLYLHLYFFLALLSLISMILNTLSSEITDCGYFIFTFDTKKTLSKQQENYKEVFTAASNESLQLILLLFFFS